MRTLFLHVNVTLDGLIEGPDREIDRHFVDDEFEAYSNRMLRSIDAIVGASPTNCSRTTGRRRRSTRACRTSTASRRST